MAIIMLLFPISHWSNQFLNSQKLFSTQPYFMLPTELSQLKKDFLTYSHFLFEGQDNDSSMLASCQPAQMVNIQKCWKSFRINRPIC